jgi:hypothetical protein
MLVVVELEAILMELQLLAVQLTVGVLELQQPQLIMEQQIKAVAVVVHLAQELLEVTAVQV